MNYATFKAIAFPNVPCRYGAPMGRRNIVPRYAEEPGAERIYNRRVPLNKSGYDPGGAYWGTGAPLRCRFTASGSYRHYYREGVRNP